MGVGLGIEKQRVPQNLTRHWHKGSQQLNMRGCVHPHAPCSTKAPPTCTSWLAAAAHRVNCASTSGAMSSATDSITLPLALRSTSWAVRSASSTEEACKRAGAEQCGE